MIRLEVLGIEYSFLNTNKHRQLSNSSKGPREVGASKAIISTYLKITYSILVFLQVLYVREQSLIGRSRFELSLLYYMVYQDIVMQLDAQLHGNSFVLSTYLWYMKSSPKATVLHSGYTEA